MQGSDVLLTIAEVSVAFAGFASIVVLFQHRDPDNWPASVVIRLRTMIECSLVALFAAIFPFVLHHLGLVGEVLWGTASVVFGLVYIAFALRVWRHSRPGLESGELSRTFAVSSNLGVAVVSLLLLVNGMGIMFQRAFGPYLVGVACTLLFASLMFLRVVVFPTSPSRS
jgi:hypothetical protein